MHFILNRQWLILFYLIPTVLFAQNKKPNIIFILTIILFYFILSTFFLNGHFRPKHSNDEGHSGYNQSISDLVSLLSAKLNGAYTKLKQLIKR